VAKIADAGIRPDYSDPSVIYHPHSGWLDEGSPRDPFWHHTFGAQMDF